MPQLFRFVLGFGLAFEVLALIGVASAIAG